MPVKGATSPPVKQWTFPSRQWRFGVLTALAFLGTLVVWTIDGQSVRSFMEVWRINNMDYQTEAMIDPEDLELFTNHNHNHNRNHNNKHKHKHKHKHYIDPAFLKEKIHPFLRSGGSGWVSAEFEPNLTTNLLAQWIFPGGEACRDSQTSDVFIPDLDLGHNNLTLSAGDAHEFVFRALDGAGNPRCSGGDYFETDLSGEIWKSRPLVKDFGNGSYSVSLQVHQDFHGIYNFTMILLYRSFEGLRFSPWRFTVDKALRNVTVRFVRGTTRLPPLKSCKQSDFDRDMWSGRWTRLARNDRCLIEDDGRYRCLRPSLACTGPWCDGPLGSLESNGWVYSTHCSFKIYLARDAWGCLKNRWIFFWGDSNHVDTIRNMLNFVLDRPDIASVPRRFDRNFTNPRNDSESVRITSIFNGHWNETMNYQGFNSLQDEGFRRLLTGYFSGEAVPDTVILNSGLHDGVFWKNIRRFSGGAHYAALFWAGVLKSVKNRGLAAPRVLYRTTVATGGYARSMAFNPMKMEAFNWVALEKFRRAGVITGVMDNFDMTFPWHFDNRCNDGVHYGRAPAKLRWRDGEIGHQYFVDLMLAHVLLNAICVK